MEQRSSMKAVYDRYDVFVWLPAGYGKSLAGADPEVLHGRWLMRWLPIVNYTGAEGWLVNNGGRLLYYLPCIKELVKGGGWLATLSTPPGSAPVLLSSLN